MKALWLVVAAGIAISFSALSSTALAAAPPGFLHVDAEAGCVFGNAPHHWFKPSGDGLFFGLVFESDDEGAKPVAIEIVATKEAYQKMSKKVQKFYHNHSTEIRMGEITLPDLKGDEAKKTMDFLATTYGRMIIISELADSGPHERTHIPTEARKYIGTFWKYIPKK